MLNNPAVNDSEMRKSFAEKIKNMVGLINQNLQNQLRRACPVIGFFCKILAGGFFGKAQIQAN